MASLLVAAASGAFACSAAGAASGSGAFTSWLVAGNGTQCATPPACGDGAAATRGTLSFPQAVAMGPEGSVYVAGWGDNAIRKVAVDGTISRLAGVGTTCRSAPSCGDGGPAADAHLNFPEGIAVDARSGTVYIADTSDNEIRKVSPQGTITRVVGTGVACAKPPACGDGGPATAAMLNSPGGVALDRHGNVYVADSGDNEIRVVSGRGVISRVAGNGSTCAKAAACGDGGPATSAQLSFPQALAVDVSGGVYIADQGDNKVRKVSAAGTIDTVAGTGSACASPPSCGDGANPKQAQLSFPSGVAIDQAGSVFVADQGDDEVRKLSGGAISTIAGSGTECAKPPSCGDGGVGTSATLDYPAGVATDAQGNVTVADTMDHEIRWLSSPAKSPARITTLVGKVSLLAFAADVGPRSVTVRGAVGGFARLTLSVSGSGHQTATVARVTSPAGFFTLRWNRRFGSESAGRGTYRLIVTASIGGNTGSSQLNVRL